MNIGVTVMTSVASRHNTGPISNKRISQIVPKMEETVNAIKGFSNNNTIQYGRKERDKPIKKINKKQVTKRCKQYSK